MSALELTPMSSAYIGQLEFAARQTSGIIRISIDCSVTPQRVEMTFRGERQREAVNGYGPDGLEDALRTMLVRLGRYRNLPTPENFIDRLTPRQLTRLRTLLDEIRAIKAEALHGIEDAEPRLASPRSSLNPAFTAALSPDAAKATKHLEGPTLELTEAL